MHAIKFELDGKELAKFGNYPSCYYGTIDTEMVKFGFEILKCGEYTVDTFYVTREDCKDSFAAVYQAINKLSSHDWFRASVKYIQAFKVEDWSDFTAIVKGKDVASTATKE